MNREKVRKTEKVEAGRGVGERFWLQSDEASGRGAGGREKVEGLWREIFFSPVRFLKLQREVVLVAER